MATRVALRSGAPFRMALGVCLMVLGLESTMAGEAHNTATGTPELSADLRTPAFLAEEDITAVTQSNTDPADERPPFAMGPPRGAVRERDPMVIKVMDASVVQHRPAFLMAPVFFWPDERSFLEVGTERAFLKVEELDWTDAFADWASHVMSFGQERPAQLKVYRQNLAVSYYLPQEEHTIVRIARNPRDKTLTFPAQIQVVRDEPISEDNMRELLIALTRVTSSRRIDDADLPLLSHAIAVAPFSEPIRRAAWQLRDFGYDVDDRVVKATFTTGTDDPSLRMQFAFGPRGSLTVLSGIGLEKLGQQRRPASR